MKEIQWTYEAEETAVRGMFDRYHEDILIKRSEFIERGLLNALVGLKVRVIERHRMDGKVIWDMELTDED